jgi:hypothetical protein
VRRTFEGPFLDSFLAAGGLQATPRHIGKAEIVARSIMPNEFWPVPVAVKVAEALARQKTQREFDADMKRLNQV